MNVIPIVVCRMDSERLPGKPLQIVAGKPLLWYVVSRCQRVPAFRDRLVVATSHREVDDPLERFCRMEGLSVYRGAAEDVAGRLLHCAQLHHADYFARINADSPFVDPQLLETALRVVRGQRFDLITNLYPRSFPYGIAVEIIRTEAFEAAYGAMRPEHWEHVTSFLYENIQHYDYFNIAHTGGDLSHLRTTIDTPEDLREMRLLASQFGARIQNMTYRDLAFRPGLKRAA